MAAAELGGSEAKDGGPSRRRKKKKASWTAVSFVLLPTGMHEFGPAFLANSDTTKDGPSLGKSVGGLANE